MTTIDTLVELLARESEQREIFRLAAVGWEARAKRTEASVLLLEMDVQNLIRRSEKYRELYSTPNTEVEYMRQTLRKLARMSRNLWPEKLEQTNRISITKEVRERFCLNLKDAKDIVDGWYRDQEGD